MLNEIDSFVRFRLIPLFSAELSLVLTESCPVLCCAGKWQFGKLKRFMRNEKENDINPVLCSGSGWKLKIKSSRVLKIAHLIRTRERKPPKPLQRLPRVSFNKFCTLRYCTPLN